MPSVTTPTLAVDPSFAAIAETRNEIYSVALADAGAVYVALRKAGGSLGWGNGTLLRRYDASGKMDPGFASGGELTTLLVANPSGLAIDASGKILIGGSGMYDPPTTSDTGKEVIVVRVNTAGTIDSSYGAAGRSKLNFSAANVWTSSIKTLSGGAVFVSAWGRTNGKESFGSFLLNPNGSAAMGYGSAGFAPSPFPTDGALASADTVLVPTSGGLVRYGADGASKGVAIRAGISAVRANKSGALFALVARGQKFVLARYTPDGAADKAFADVEVGQDLVAFEPLADGSCLIATPTELQWTAPTGGSAVSVLPGVSADTLLATADGKLLITSKTGVTRYAIKR
jgi:hypothetical protein